MMEYGLEREGKFILEGKWKKEIIKRRMKKAKNGI
jgi:hypothetical protein